MENKKYFKFCLFSELNVGDVFKFSKEIDCSIKDVFYSVYLKSNNITKINSTYGKTIIRHAISSDSEREVMIYPNRKRN